MSDENYDVIVLGVGGVGSNALDHLARRGLRVLGLDRFVPGHDRGSSHGETRLIRQAYFEHPDYVPLLKRAYELWAELSERTGQTLYHEVGVLQAGRPDGEVVPGVLKSARQHQLEVEELTPNDVAKRFPGFRIPESLKSVFERRAGYLDVEDCVKAAASQAVARGATIKTGESIRGWSAEGTGVRVETDRGVYRADRLVVTAGAWAGTLLGDLTIPFEVIRKSLYWYRAPESYAAEQGTPGFIFETDAGNFYGFPQIHGALKAAEHTGGLPVTDPLTVDRSPDSPETARLEQFLRNFLPGVSSEQVRFATCMYTLSPDRKFVVDRHPEFPQVAFAAGLSGHGFKFVTVLGEALAHLAERGETRLPIDFLNCRRAELRATTQSR